MCVFVLRFSLMAAIVHRAGPHSQRSPHPRIACPRPERATLDGGRRAILGAVDKRRELGQFLKSRRARLRPEAVGLQPHGRRRVPGLRREELAQLAGVSVDYYVRLEQGRTANVSREVLDAVARALRLAAGRHPDDPELAALVGELSVKSEDFRRWWAAHDVLEKTHGTKRLMHPIVGPLTLAFETLLLPGDGDQVLGIYTAEPGSESETALRLLASIASQSGRRDGPDAAAGTGKVEAKSRG